MAEQIINSKINGFKGNFECNNCGNKQEVNLFPYINFSQNPEYYSLVKDLSIYRVKCEKCGYEELIKFDTLIVDEVHKYFIYFLTDRALHERFKYQIRYFIETDLNRDGKYDLDKEYKTRLVFDQNDLIEKMAIFEVGLSDEAIEMTKSMLFDSNIVDESKWNVIYFDGMQDADLIFVALNSNTSSVEPNRFVVSHEFYNNVIDKLEFLKAKDRDYFEVIDRAWVKSNFKYHDEAK